ncbi:MAG: hypothetical protein HYV29_04540 [Ignavibacteriales bacterium]|nr:hypothetical protein [Ignavibacteriales bacterium]
MKKNLFVISLLFSIITPFRVNAELIGDEESQETITVTLESGTTMIFPRNCGHEKKPLSLAEGGSQWKVQSTANENNTTRNLNWRQCG